MTEEYISFSTGNRHCVPISPRVLSGIEASYRARRRARVLLDAAKRAAEIAIEESEAAGLEYLKEMAD